MRYAHSAIVAAAIVSLLILLGACDSEDEAAEEYQRGYAVGYEDGYIAACIDIEREFNRTSRWC